MADPPSLVYWGKKLPNVPPEVFNYPSLQKLSLKLNHIEELPHAFSKLENLTELNLSSNKFTSVPSCISSLPNLTALDLTGNPLTCIPAFLGQMPNLHLSLDTRLCKKYLHVNGQTLSETTKHILESFQLPIDEVTAPYDDPFRWTKVKTLVHDKLHLREKLLNHDRSYYEIEDSDCLAVNPNAELGRGTFGITYLCRYEDMNVAVKVMPMPNELTEDMEIHFNCAIRHPNIARCYGFVAKPKEIKLVMELANTSLSQLFKKMTSKGVEPFSSALVSKLCTDLCLGLNYLHLSGIIHRDLSLGNSLLFSDWTLKISDFGCSESVGTMDPGSGEKGDLRYQSIEAKNRYYSFASDLWSYGIIMADICLCRETPKDKKDWTPRERDDWLHAFSYANDSEKARGESWLQEASRNDVVGALLRRKECTDSVGGAHPEMLHILTQALQIERLDIEQPIGLRGTAGDFIAAWALLIEKEGWRDVDLPYNPKTGHRVESVEEYVSSNDL